MEDTRPGQREQKTMENHGKSQFLMGKLTINGHFQ
jgi:hypothetical protein